MARISVTTSPYMMLTKPGIIMGNGITAIAGFILASRGGFNPFLFLATVVGLSLIIASACVFNNYIDQEADQKMKRTKKRAQAFALLSTKKVLLFAVALGMGGSAVLYLFTNILALSIALFGFGVYVLLYTFSKTKTRHGTLIGSVAGAVPPVVGYCGASGEFDLGALLFFLIMALWQIPHFFAIAIFRMEDYAAASIPVLPIVKGVKNTKIQMLLYIILFTAAASLLFVYHYVGWVYLITTLCLGTSWFLFGCKGFRAENDKIWARKMFFFSLFVIMAISFVIPIDLFVR